MSVVAPISATGVILPVAVGVATGDALSLLVSAGLVITIVGVLLASRERHDRAPPQPRPALSLVLALLAAVGFGSYFVLSDVAADESILWLLALARIVVVPVLAAVVLAARAPARRGRRYAARAGRHAGRGGDRPVRGGREKGATSIVSVVGSLYPITTVLLARRQSARAACGRAGRGVAAAFTGVALIVAG